MMVWLRYVWRGLVRDWGSSLFIILALAVGMGGMALTRWLMTSVPEVYKLRQGPVDIVIGAKGVAPLDLSLCCAIFSRPSTGLVSQKTIESATKSPMIAQMIGHKAPIALGDSYLGHPIIWTDNRIFDFYEGLNQGRVFMRPMEVVVGARLAQQSQLTLGQKITSSHGFETDGEAHDIAYTVVGILSPTGSAADEALFASLGSIPILHGDAATVHPDHGHEDEHDMEEGLVSAYIVRLKDKSSHAIMPGLFNDDERLQAVSPLLEMSKLRAAFRPIEDMLRLQSQLLAGFAAITFLGLISLNFSRNRHEFDIMRMLGAHIWQLWLLVFGQAAFLGHLAFGLSLGCGLVMLRLWPEYVTIFGLQPKLETLWPIMWTIYAALWALSLCASLPTAWLMFNKTNSEEWTL